MSRLIDADAFEKFIKEKYEDGESTDDIKDQMLFDLSYQPTAYDVEKVVEELKEKKLLLCSKGVNQFNSILWCEGFCNTCVILDIIRKGGAE